MNGNAPGTTLLLGASGQLGRALLAVLAERGDVVATVHRPQPKYERPCRVVDLALPDQLRSVVREVAPRWIINAAAYTAVDRAETEQAAARAMNEVAPTLLAEEAARIGAGLIHYSTDYVFDGSGNAPWREDDPVAPLSVYGRTKAAGEAGIRQSGGLHWIVRTSAVYGPQGNHFIYKMWDLARRSAEIAVVNDQVTAPTSTRLLAETTAGLLKSVNHDPARLAQRGGLLHVACGGETSWFEYAREIFRWTAARQIDIPVPRLRAVSTARFAAPAPRPLNCRLDTRRLRESFGIVPQDWRAELQRELPALYADFVARSERIAHV